jgi:hypothetical protein
MGEEDDEQSRSWKPQDPNLENVHLSHVRFFSRVPLPSLIFHLVPARKKITENKIGTKA